MTDQPAMSQAVSQNRMAFRRALGSFVTGVTIITTCDAQGAPAGLTANSFNSVSLDPPLVLFSLALDSTSLDAFRQAGWWAVHVLAAGQEDLSNRFASRDAEKFDGIDFMPGPGGIPLLAEFAARFICRAAFEYEGGDHAIFLGAVESFEQAGRPPLVYHQGRYGGIFPAAEADSAPAGADRAAAWQRQGLAERRDGGWRLTRQGCDVAFGLVALAEDGGTGLSAHETSALRHLITRLTG